MAREITHRIHNGVCIALFFALAVAFVAVFMFAGVAYAQSTTYWCGSYYSYQPCGYSGYYQYPQYPSQNYYSGYPSSYYPQYQYSPQYYYPQPTCSITYTQTNNPNYWQGGMYTQAIQLSWSSNYATSAYITGVGSVSPSGIRVVYPYGYTQYALTVYGPGGTNTCYVYFQPQQYYYQQSQPQYWGQVGYNYGYNYGNYYGY
jgi:hypothetical protein